MRRVILGKTGLKVYQVGFGGIPIQRVSEKQAVETVLHAVESGVDFIDTARAYTTSETRIGKALSQTNKKVIMATKSLERSAEGIRKDIEKSMAELKTDYIDLYQSHLVQTEADYKKIMSPGGAFEGLLKAKDEGIIGHIGLSSHSQDRLCQVIEEGYFETVMTCFSFIESAAAEKVIPGAIREGIGVIAMKPFSGGVIDEPELALKYVLSHQNIVIIPGVESPSLFDKNWRVFQEDQRLRDSERLKIEAIRKEYDKIFCRRCDYCQPCSEEIPIQIILGIKSFVKRSGMEILGSPRVQGAIKNARNCSECGECLERCPYDLPIPDLIKENLQWVDNKTG
jgi:predicted aldo/keto reductase-like oxidoreductase